MTAPGEWEKWINTVQCLDCLEGMRQMPDGCVHCVVTSPPYYRWLVMWNTKLEVLAGVFALATA